MTDAPRVALVATAKDEGPYILEWVAHHRLCGFDPIIIYQNDSVDGTDRILAELDRLGIIRYFDNPAEKNRQAIAYKRAGHLPEFRAADYFMSLDLDELFCGFEPPHSVQALIAMQDDFDTMIVNWRNFGSAGLTEFEPALVAERFTRTHPKDEATTKLRGYKTINRTGSWQRAGAHSPREPLKPEDQMVVINASGLRYPEFRRESYRATDPKAYANAQVNHYATRELWSFVRKSLKGGGNNPDRRLPHGYWRRNDRNEVEDRMLADRADALHAEVARLDALSDGKLGKMTNTSVKLTLKGMGRLKTNPEAQALIDAIKNSND